jgi:hypothetical protein
MSKDAQQQNEWHFVIAKGNWEEEVLPSTISVTPQFIDEYANIIENKSMDEKKDVVYEFQTNCTILSYNEEIAELLIKELLENLSHFMKSNKTKIISFSYFSAKTFTFSQELTKDIIQYVIKVLQNNKPCHLSLIIEMSNSNPKQIRPAICFIDMNTNNDHKELFKNNNHQSLYLFLKQNLFNFILNQAYQSLPNTGETLRLGISFPAPSHSILYQQEFNQPDSCFIKKMLNHFLTFVEIKKR